MIKKKEGTLLLDGLRLNKLNSSGAGAMGCYCYWLMGLGVEVADGGERSKSNHDGTRAHWRKGGLDGVVGIGLRGSCTWLHMLSKLDDC